MRLSNLARGSRARIARLPEGHIRVQFIRMGIVEGAVIQCLERLPGGTMVLEHSRQELALSTELADAVFVHPL